MKSGLLYFAIFGMSCFSARMESTRDPDFNQVIDKMYVTLRGSKEARNGLEAMSAALEKELTSRNIRSKGYLYPELARVDEDQQVTQDIVAFGAVTALIISQTEEKRAPEGSSYSYKAGMTFDIKLLECSSQKIVWRARFSSSTQLPLEGETIARKIIAGLVRDKMIK